MKNIFGKYVVSIILAVGAIVLALNHISGWGWFILGTILSLMINIPDRKIKGDENNNDFKKD